MPIPKPKVTKLALKTVKNKQIVQEEFVGRFTREEIKKYTQKYSNSLAKKGFTGEIQATILYPGEWAPGRFTPVGKPIRLYDYHDSDRIGDNEPDYFERFTIYLQLIKEPAGIKL